MVTTVIRAWRAAAAGWFGRNAAALAAGLVGVLWFVVWAEPRVLLPTHLGWLMSGEDWTQHLLGWLFFRNESLAFPLGALPGMVHPIGTTLGFTDSLPWVSVLLRPFSGLLPVDFQFIGPWLALCFFLQGALGAWLVSAFTRYRLIQFVAGSLFAFSPVLISRVGHEALCAQWMLVALLGLHARGAPDAASARQQLVVAALLVALAAGIHPYLTVMVLALAIALVWKLARVDRSLRALTAVLVAVGLAAIALGLFALFGYLGGGAGAMDGFDRYNADLLALINPRDRGRLMPALASTASGEGYGYLGLGGIALVAAAAITLLLPQADRAAIPFRRAWPAAIVALGAAFYSLGPTVKVARVELVSLGALYAHLDFITGPFRSAGRFIWILHLGLLASALIVLIVGWRARPGVVACTLVAAAFLQLLDFDFRPGDLFRRQPIDAGLHSPVWNELGREYRHLALVPAQIAWTGGPCEGELPGHLRWPFAYQAYRQGMTFNGGYVARMDREAMVASCREFNASVRRGELDPATVYVVGPSFHAALKRTKDRAVCGRVDAYTVCVSAAFQGEVRRKLEAHPR
jgi:hypothetical protein